MQAVLRWLRPPRRILPTRAGLFALGAPFVLGVAAINASNNLLFLLLGACLGTIILSGILSERALGGVVVSVWPVGEVHAAEECRMVVRVERSHATADSPAAFGIRVRERVSRRARKRGGKLNIILPVIEGGSARVLAGRRFARRGRAVLAPCEVLTSYPFGLLIKSRDLDTECAVVVRPRRIDVPAALASPRGAAAGGASAVQRGLGQDIYGLRERQEHDPAHRIHALRSLSLGRDVIVEMEATRKPTAWLGIVNAPGANPDAFERALEIAAATLAAWDEAGYAVGLRSVGRIWSPGAEVLSDLLDALALLEIETEISPENDDGEPLWLVPAGASPPAGVDADSIAVVDVQGGLHIAEGKIT